MGLMLTPEQVQIVVELANSFRSVFDKDPLTELPAGIPNDPKECLLARAFDCGFEVMSPEGRNVNWLSEEELELIEESMPDTSEGPWWFLEGNVTREEFEALEKWALSHDLMVRPKDQSEYETTKVNEDKPAETKIPYGRIEMVIVLPPAFGDIAWRFDEFELDDQYYDLEFMKEHREFMAKVAGAQLQPE